MRQYSFTKSFLNSIHLSLFAFLLTSAMLLGISVSSNAQATLSVQGIVKKSNGVALEDGEYSMTFRMYAVAAPTVVLWTEAIPNVDVISGIYSVILGEITPLDLAFNEDYELGVSIGSQEMLPRIKLTSAPYALALRGETNQFPSTGQVQADEIIVAQGVLASGGAPGLNGVDKNGYAFQGNSGDNDSGLFSTGDGKASIYSNNAEVLAVTPGAVSVNGNFTNTGTFTTGNVNLSSGGTINYNGQNDWRLVDTDYFNSSSDGWMVYDKLSSQSMGWNNPSPLGNAPIQNLGTFIGNALLPASNDHVLKKLFVINGSGPFTEIKVKFRYYYIDLWGFGGGDRSWAAFATSPDGSNIRVGFSEMGFRINHDNHDIHNGTPSMREASNFFQRSDVSDYWTNGEMTARANGNSFWLFFGAAVDGPAADERYAVGGIEVYVK